MSKLNQVLEELETSPNEWLSARNIADAVGMTITRAAGNLHHLLQKGFVERRGTAMHYEYKISDRGKRKLHPYDDFTVKQAPATTSAATADEIAAAIFKKIQEMIDENRDLKEENKQLRVLAGKAQSKPVQLPSWAVVKNGD